MKYLQKIGVTHVLNTAEGDVNINPNKYRKEGITYWGFRQCPDLPHSDISQFFDEAVEFLDRALSFPDISRLCKLPSRILKVYSNSCSLPNEEERDDCFRGSLPNEMLKGGQAEHWVPWTTWQA